MKPAEAKLVRALDAADPAIRLFLLHGPDEAGARAYADRLGKALGADAERIDLASSQLRADPARLADEAAALPMFGGPRWIRIDPATDEAADAVAALLTAPAAGNPAVAIGPALRKDAKLVKLAAASGAAIVHACYPPEGRDADALAVELGREQGLLLQRDIARRLAAATGGDRAILTRELEKFALFLDAAPERPKPLEADTIDALGAAAEEGDLSRLGLTVFAGDVAATEAELARLAAEAVTGVPLVRALARRALLLAQLRGQMAAGDSVERVMETAGRGIFWKERDATGRSLARWEAADLATAATRLAEAERQVKAPGYPGDALVNETVLAIARHAARRR